jgi:type III pantothenate kinase
MLLAVDIGNSAVKFGLFEGDTLTEKFSIQTKRNTSTSEIKLDVGERLSEAESAIVCSVVPGIEPAMNQFLRDITGAEPILVDNSLDFGIKIDYRPLESLGTDRLVNAYAVVEKFGPPCIVCSLGTATTIDVVNAEREFLGGVIAPGMDAMAEALHQKAPRLPSMEIVRPEHLLGNSTADAIQSGVYNGYVGMVEGLITRIRSASGVSRIVGTGGNAQRLSDEFTGIMTFEPDLILQGLRMVAKKFV